LKQEFTWFMEEENQPFLDPLNSTLNFEQILQQPISKKKRIVYLKYYWKILFLLAVFYAVPSFQFVVAKYSEFLNGEEYCYYNYKCMHQSLGLKAFNNVLSNIGYVILGVFFIFHVRIANKNSEEDEKRTKGLHFDMSLYYALGWTLVFEGIFSGLYHVCPTKIDFQFDTTFMMMGAGLLFITVYQKRQPTITSGAFQVYGYFAGILSLNVLSLLPIPDKVFWIVVFYSFSLCISFSFYSPILCRKI